MKHNIFFKALVLALLVAGGLTSCEKDPIPPQNPSTNPIDSNDLTGVWDWIDSLYLCGDQYLYITFDSIRYSVQSHYMFNESIHRCFFYDHESGKYRIEDGWFYKWDVEGEFDSLDWTYPIIDDENFSYCKAKRTGDTLVLSIGAEYTVPNAMPGRYIFVKR